MAKKDKVTEALKKHFGFDTFKGNQKAIIENVLAGKDTFVLMPTGGGKSLCYQLPSLMMEGTAIVVSPLIALMKNQVDAMRNFSEEDGIAHFINSSLSKSAIDQVKGDILSGKTKLLYVAPESLTKEENVEFLRQVKISFYAVDEAHYHQRNRETSVNRSDRYCYAKGATRYPEEFGNDGCHRIQILFQPGEPIL